ncbi:MAG: MFS transporter [Deltaproteobacteria bacterium]|nr:MFS transporter [Deltaproteobacteria bacterium]
MTVPTPSTADRKPKLASLQWRVAVLTWVSYASYYLTRKHFSVAKSRLQGEFGLSEAALGAIDTAYLGLYAVGQFVNGALGDRVGARRMIGVGMLASAATSVVMGFGTTTTLFLVCFGLNGLFQSTGWPNNVKAMTPWFSAKSRGKVMGLWCTCYQVGGIAATALATTLLVTLGWRWAFRVPGAWVAGIGAIVLLFLVERPQDRGLPPVDPPAGADGPAASSDGGADETSAEDGEANAGDGAGDDGESEASAAERTGFSAMIRKPVVWSLGLAYFGLKLIRYSLLFWLPYYLTQIGYDEGTAGYLSTAFEAGGIAGAIGVGWLSDKRFPGARARLLVPMLIALAGALGVYRLVGEAGIVANATSMALVGFLLFGPDALISGAAAQDVGGGASAASAAGIINGVGSIGAMLQAFVTVGVHQTWGWGALFYVFIGLALFSASALVPMALREGARARSQQ